MSDTGRITQAYDRIGTNYAQRRQADPRLERLHAALGSGRLLNVGAGAGSYEPGDRPVVALEPSAVMIEQRPPSSAPVVQGVAEALPFADRSFDVVMAILTVHHWNDIEAGLKELCRVAPRRIVLTFDAAVHARFWLMDYLPALNDVQSQRRAPSIPELMTAIEGNEILVLPVPWDCLDGMTIAYWRRPKAYLREHNHAGGSSLRQIDADARRVGLAKLRDDLDSGRWQQRYRHLLELEECDLGLRLAIGQAK